MDTNYDPKKHEAQLYSLWEAGAYFTADPNSSKKPYSLLMPPPNLTGEPHIGHAMQHAILDAVARFKRMQGHDVLLLPGVDHAGIQFEGTFTKILEKQGLSKQKLGREEWLKKAWEFRDKVYETFHGTWSVFGISADWSREVFTLEDKVRRAVLTEFQTFFDQGLIYKGAYIVQWCPKDQTAIEDVEMEYEEKTVKLYSVRYLIDGTDLYITVATTRPETIYADSGIAIYPNHPLFGRFADKFAINPLTGEKIPVFEDARIDKEFGTGAVKMTPGHDPLDFKIGKDKNLPILHAVDKTGKMTELAQDFFGMKAADAREKVAEKLQGLGALEKAEDYTHSVPVCERCKTTIEPLISEEWFVRMEPLTKKALKEIGKINFVPSNYNKILTDWITGVHDWCISRPLWWGYQIPVWFCEKCNPQHKVGRDSQMVISFDQPAENCKACGEKHWAQEEKVLDTWFSSGLWPLATLGWPEENEELKRYYPWDFELSAPEIKYLWIARMIMLGVWFAGKIPFKNMLFHGTLRDLQGRKMSKSLGNGVDPLELIKQWGTDAVRMTLYSYAAPGRDPKASRGTMDARAKNYRNFANKLWNISRFILEPKFPDGPASATSDDNGLSHPDDLWIKAELAKTIGEVTKNLENFQLHLAIENIYEFVWHRFADIYLEKTKDRRRQAQPTLLFVLEKILIILHPFMPFITEKIWQESRVKISRRDTSNSGREKLFNSHALIITQWPKE